MSLPFGGEWDFDRLTPILFQTVDLSAASGAKGTLLYHPVFDFGIHSILAITKVVGTGSAPSVLTHIRIGDGSDDDKYVTGFKKLFLAGASEAIGNPYELTIADPFILKANKAIITTTQLANGPTFDLFALIGVPSQSST